MRNRILAMEEGEKGCCIVSKQLVCTVSTNGIKLLQCPAWTVIKLGKFKNTGTCECPYLNELAHH